MRRALAVAAGVAAMAGLAASRAPAQHVVAGVGVALAEYREQGPSLGFRGSGPSGTLELSWRRVVLAIAGAHLALRPTTTAAGAEPFTLSQVDVRLGVRAVRNVSVEAGLIRRDVTPDHAAQALGAARLGLRAALPLAVGADVAVRGAYLTAATFSGGGSAPFGVEVGMRVSYGPGSGRVRAMADFEFLRLDRRTTVGGARVSVPLQSSVARVGLAVAF